MLIVETKGAQRTLVTPIFDAPMHVQKARVVENAVIVCHRVITDAQHAQMEKLVAVLHVSVPQEKNWHQGEGARNVQQESMEQTAHATTVAQEHILPQVRHHARLVAQEQRLVKVRHHVRVVPTIQICRAGSALATLVIRDITGAHARNVRQEKYMLDN